MSLEATIVIWALLLFLLMSFVFWHVHEGSLCLSEVGGGILEAGLDRTFPSDSEISERPFPGDGMRLGGRIWDVRTY